MNTREVLTLAVEIAQAMIRNGAEISRVEDTCTKIIDSFGIVDYDVYVLSNGIFASANEGRDDACSVIRHIPLGKISLTRISALNQLARDICEKKIDIATAWDKLEECKKLPFAPDYLQMIAMGIGSGGFAILFGATAMEGGFACLIGLVLYLLTKVMKKNKVARFAVLLLSSMFITVLAFIPVIAGLNVSLDKIVIGSIMPLVPGISFTTSIRDIYNGDYLSGTIHLIDALFTAMCIAVGVGIVIALFHTMGGVL